MPPKVAPTASLSSAATQPVELRIGLGGSPKIMSSGTSYSINYYMQGRQREVPQFGSLSILRPLT